jgi:acyl carrier protein
MEIKTMDKDIIKEKINGFLVDEFEIEPGKITPEGNLRETLGLDSLDYIDLAVVIEGNFGFKVRHEDFATLHTFQDLYDYIAQRVGEKIVS